jgi:uncharacterized protein
MPETRGPAAPSNVTNRLALGGLLGLTFVVLAQSASAAPVPAHCKTPGNATEKTICTTPALSRLDLQMTAAYNEVRDIATGAQFADVRAEQKDWLLNDRNSCGKKVSCLTEKYEDRIAVLEQTAESLANPNKSPASDDQTDDTGGSKPKPKKPAKTTDANPTSGMVWQASAPTGGRPMSRLDLSVPETDNAAFESVCRSGAGRGMAETIFGYDTSGLSGNDVTMEVTIDGDKLSLAATISGTDREEGVSGLGLTLATDDPLWSAMAYGKDMQYRVRGQPTVRLPLKSAKGAITQFFAGCHAIASGKPPAPAMANVASQPTCDEVRSLSSTGDDQAVRITFVNRTGMTRGLLWVDGDSQPIDKANIEPGGSFVANTFANHAWMLTDGPGNCAEVFVAGSKSGSFEVTAPNPPGGAEND